MAKTKFNERTNRLISIFLLVVMLSALLLPTSVQAGVPSSDVSFSVVDLKVTSSPVEEENDFTVEAVYRASVTNYGWDSSVWHQCGSCGGAGSTRRYPTGGTDGGGTKNVTLTCGQSFEGRTWMCRSACDGFDYTDQEGMEGEVTHDTENPWDPGHTNNWDDGGEHIWDKANRDPCDCKMPVKVDSGANNGMIACRGCGGVGSIYMGTADCGSCDSTNQSNCKSCNGTGSVKVFETCMECGGLGAVTEFITCASCGGSGGQYVTVHHDPVEPPSSITTTVDISLDGVLQDSKEITINMATTVHDGYTWTKSGEVAVEWVINAGEGIGDKKVETTIDGGDEEDERKEIIVKVEPACNLTVEFVPPNAPYRSGTEVVSTFVVKNHNSELGLDIKPKHKLAAELAVKDKASGKTLATVKKGDIVIPKGVSNIVYFKWLVPVDFSGQAELTCKVNVGYVMNSVGVNEDSMADNTATVVRDIQKYDTMVTPDTKLELSTPRSYNKQLSAPQNTADNLTNATWEQWEWKNDGYVLNKYGCAINTGAAIKAEKTGGWQKNDGSKWTTRSGYGINARVTAGDRQTAKDDMITDVQHCAALVPEFNYKIGKELCTSLEATTPGKASVVFELPNKRIHYTPIYFPDGKYDVSFYVYDYWSPAGMLSGHSTDHITIKGDMYDDWNSNRR